MLKKGTSYRLKNVSQDWDRERVAGGGELAEDETVRLFAWQRRRSSRKTESDIALPTKEWTKNSRPLFLVNPFRKTSPSFHSRDPAFSTSLVLMRTDDST